VLLLFFACDRQIERTKQLTQQAEIEKSMSIPGVQSGVAPTEKVIRTKAGKQVTSYAAQKIPNDLAADDSNDQKTRVSVATFDVADLPFEGCECAFLKNEDGFLCVNQWST
jgi:hypothetical protein